MRIIGGHLRSRRIKSIPGLAVRPTPDRLREALFNVLAMRIQGAVFLDAYAGTGAVGIEALSRGARQIILFERNAAALAVLRENLRSLEVDGQSIVVRGSASVLLANYRPDIAFLDPPYEKVGEYRMSLEALSSGDCPLVIAQHPSRLVLAEDYGQLTKTRVLKQGDNSLSFYARTRDGEGDDSAGQQ